MLPRVEVSGVLWLGQGFEGFDVLGAEATPRPSENGCEEDTRGFGLCLYVYVELSSPACAGTLPVTL